MQTDPEEMPRARRRRWPFVLLAAVMVAVVALAAYRWNHPAKAFALEPWQRFDTEVVVDLDDGEFTAQSDDSCRASVDGTVQIGWVAGSTVRSMGQEVPSSWNANADSLAGPFTLRKGASGSMLNANGHDSAYNDDYPGRICQVSVGRARVWGFDLPDGSAGGGELLADSQCRRAYGLTHNEIEVGLSSKGCELQKDGYLGFFSRCRRQRSMENTVCPEMTRMYLPWLGGV